MKEQKKIVDNWNNNASKNLSTNIRYIIKIIYLTYSIKIQKSYT